MTRGRIYPAPTGASMTFDAVPGVIETREAHGETTLVVDPARVVEACRHLRDEHGFNMLADGLRDWLDPQQGAGR